MNFFETACFALGLSVLIASAICGLFFAVGAAIDRVKVSTEKERGRIAEQAVDTKMSRLMDDSWWFSEHPPTMNLLQNIAEGIIGVNSLRERWRKEMNEAKKEAGDEVKLHVSITPERLAELEAAERKLQAVRESLAYCKKERSELIATDFDQSKGMEVVIEEIERALETP